jgi:hypothetical protein
LAGMRIGSLANRQEDSQAGTQNGSMADRHEDSQADKLAGGQIGRKSDWPMGRLPVGQTGIGPNWHALILTCLARFLARCSMSLFSCINALFFRMAFWVEKVKPRVLNLPLHLCVLS